MPQKRRKRQRRGESTVPGDRLRAERPDHVWAFDFQFDVTDDGRAVKLLYVVDEFTREALAMEAERRIDADKLVDVLDRIVSEQRPPPEFVRCDNGPEMTSNALRDWCRFCRTGAAFIEPGSPWENPFVESFNSRVRDELLAVEVFTLPDRGEGDDRGLPPGLQPLPATPSARDDDPGRVRRQPPNSRCSGRQQLRLGKGSSSVASCLGRPATHSQPHSDRVNGRIMLRTSPQRRPQPTAAGLPPTHTNNHPALTAGGPMNGVRSVSEAIVGRVRSTFWHWSEVLSHRRGELSWVGVCSIRICRRCATWWVAFRIASRIAVAIPSLVSFRANTTVVVPLMEMSKALTLTIECLMDVIALKRIAASHAGADWDGGNNAERADPFVADHRRLAKHRLLVALSE